MSNVFLADVLAQPKSMREAIATYRTYEQTFEKIAALQPKQIIFAGMGSSHYCSIPASIKLNAAGLYSSVYSASELLYYEWNAITTETLLVLISQSGESGEIVDIIQKLPREQLVIGITNEAESALSKRADICLEMQVKPEQAASTRTYLASLILTDMLAEALIGHNVQDALVQCEQAVDALETFLTDHAAMQDTIGTLLAHPESVCFIGRGPAVATAEAGALFTRETAKCSAVAFESAEFRHGPFEIVDHKFGAVIYAPSGVTVQLQAKLTQDIAEHDGKVVFVTDAEMTFDSPNVVVLRHPAVPEAYATLVQIVAAQLFANDMALYLGYVPGEFRQASKVTTVQ